MAAVQIDIPVGSLAVLLAGTRMTATQTKTTAADWAISWFKAAWATGPEKLLPASGQRKLYHLKEINPRLHSFHPIDD